MAKKTAVNKKSTAQGYTFSIAAEEVLRRVNFGTFEVILTKRGAMFKTYTGYHIWCTPYVSDAKGTSVHKTLYSYLVNLIDQKDECEKKGEEFIKYADTGELAEITYNDYLALQKNITEANLLKPLTVFSDQEYAYREAKEYYRWLTESMNALMESSKEYKASEEDNERIEQEEIALMDTKEILKDSMLDNARV